MSKSIIIVTLNTSGYGSPQWLYLHDQLKLLGNKFIRIYEPYEKCRPFFEIQGYDRCLVKYKMLWVFLPAILALKTWVCDMTIITSRPSLMYFIKRPGANFIYYNLELQDVGLGQVFSFKNIYRYIREYIFMKFTKKIVTTSELRAEYLRKKYNHKSSISVMKNCPPIDKIVSMPKLLEKNDSIVILYQGQISEESQATKLMDLIEQTKDYAEWNIAGAVDYNYKAALDKLVKKSSNVIYHGYLTSEKLSLLRSMAHVGIVTWGVGPTINHTLSSPNKFYEYISSGLIVLSFFNKQMIVEAKLSAGVIVSPEESRDVSFLASAINELKDKKFNVHELSSSNLLQARNAHNFEFQFSQCEYLFSTKIYNS